MKEEDDQEKQAKQKKMSPMTTPVPLIWFMLPIQ